MIKKLLEKIIKSDTDKTYLFENIKDSIPVKEQEFIFCTGMGRSGSHFLARLVEFAKQTESYHLDQIGNPVADSFFQFAKWYGLNIDLSPFLSSRAYLGNQAHQRGKKYFEANPYLNLHVKDLAQHFNSKILILYRDPKKVVESHFNKGWYKNYNPSFNAEEHQLPGYQYQLKESHYFFGRFFPKEPGMYKKWMNFTRVGKISWMWKTIYTSILKDIESLDNCRLLQIETTDYIKYKKVCHFLNIKFISEKQFQKVLSRKPGRADYKSLPNWTDTDQKEFYLQTEPVMKALKNNSKNL